MKNKLFLAWIALLLAALACGGGGGGTKTAKPPDNSIGSIRLIHKDVLQNNQAVTGTQSLLQDAVIGVFNGGLGDLFFTGGLALRLFNDTQVGGVSADPSPGSSLLARMRLEFGGFTGKQTGEGTQTTIETPNGATITVAGTNFFVVYDPGSQVTYCGNFGGRIAIQAAGSPPIGIPDGQIYRVDPGAPPVYWQDIPWSMDEFNEIAAANQSPMAPLEAAGPPPPLPPQDITPPVFELLSLDPPSIVYGSECPGTFGETQLTMRILDENQIANAMVEWELNGVFESRPMERIDDQTYTVLIGPLQDFGVLNIVVRAEDMFGNAGQSEPIQVKVAQCIG
jgi:hypothetical protein